LLFYFHQEVFKLLFTFCHKGGVICISEVIDISLLLNMLSRLVITFLPRTKCLLISWLWPPSDSDFGAPKIKV
ncbi:hypothetical protein D9R19_12305, partial [Corynebacterium diphtheriae]